MIKNDIMVSVSCIAYNHEKYIVQCLEGLLMQKTNFKFEILVHDDASTDRTADIIREYEKKYPDIIKPIYQTENQYSKGIPITSTYQYFRAKGKYFATCEGDDYWCDEYKLQKQYDLLEAHPECDFCVCKVQAVSESGKKMKKTYPDAPLSSGILSPDEFLKVACHDYQFQTSGYFTRKESEIMYFELNLSYKNVAKKAGIGDWPKLLYYGSRGSVVYIDDVMSCYRVNSIGSFDYNLQKNNKLHEHYQNMIKMMECFNKETEGRFEQYCNDFIFIYLCFARDYKKALSKKYRTYFKQCSRSYRIRLILSAYCPALVKLYEKIKGY